MPKRRPAPVKPPIFLERAYLKAMQTALFRPIIKELETVFATATTIEEIQHHVDRIFGIYGSKDAAAAVAAGSLRKIASYHQKVTARTLGPALGVNVMPLIPESALTPIMSTKIQQNAALIMSVQGRLKEQLTTGIQQTFAEKGFDREALMAFARERVGVSNTNAKRIARDQTNKAIGDFTQTRQQQLGINEYEWVTADDERVVGTPGGLYPKGNARHNNHYARHGQIFSWDSPPPDGHPGQGIQCRCVAKAIIPEARA